MRLRIIGSNTNTPQVMFQPFEMRELVDKVAGSAILARTLLLQTRLLVMLQVNTRNRELRRLNSNFIPKSQTPNPEP
jgi:hypothetical protein